MRINVLHDYGSVSLGARRILPGVYDIDDPLLFGRGQYLLENGHAVVVVDDTAQFKNDPHGTPLEPETVIDDTQEREWLKIALDERNIDFDGRWGVERLRAALAESEDA